MIVGDFFDGLKNLIDLVNLRFASVVLNIDTGSPSQGVL